MINIVTRNCIGIVAVITSISGCSTLDIPDWVEDKSPIYTSKAYLLGHGVGQNQSVAEDNASRKITQHFKSIITSEELSSQTNIIFNQIEFKAPWLNTDTSEYHVLAFISRDKAASFIQNKMLALDELTYQFFEQAKVTTDLLEQTSYIDSAINAQTRRVDLKPILRVINSKNDIPSSYNIARLSKIRNQLQARVNLRVDVTSDKLGELDTIIKSSLETAGFIRNNTIKTKNHLLVDLKIEETEIPESSGALLMQGVLITSLQHHDDKSAENIIRGSHQWTFSVTADNRKKLIQKSRDNLTSQLRKNLKQVIMDMMVIEYDTEEAIPNQDYVDFDMPEFNRPENNTDITSATQATIKSGLKSRIKSKINPDSVNTTPETAKVDPINKDMNKNKKNQNISKKSTVIEPTQSDKQLSENNSTTTKAKMTKSDSLNANPPLNKTKDTTVTDIDDPISSLPPLAN